MAILSIQLSWSARASAASTKGGLSRAIRRRRLDRFGARKAGDYGRILARASKPSEVAQPQPSPGRFEREDPSPFFDAMLRSFLLGMAGSVVFESIHVMAKVWGLSDGQGLGQLIGSLPGSLDGIQPMYFADHLAAVALMIFLYTVDAVAMVDVLKRYPDDKEGAKWMLQNMATLSKKMLPLKLTLFKTFVLSVTPSVAQAGLLAGNTVPRSSQPASKEPFTASLATVADAAVCTPAPAQDTAQKPEVPDMLERERERLQRLLRRDAALRDAPATAPEKSGAGEKASSAPGKLRRNGLKPGQLDPGSSDWARRRVEEAEEKMLLKNFWYAAVASSAVTSSKPVGVEMLGLNLVLFRNSAGRVVALDSVCPHRAAPLSQGWLKTENEHDCVVCPYHAWAFDEEGRVQDIPAQPKKKAWPRRPLLQSYDVQESGGLVWLFYGNKQLPLPERPPLPPLGSSGLVPGRSPAFRTVVEQANLESVSHVAAFKAALEAAGTFLRRNGPATGLELSMGEVGPFAVERAVLLPASSLPMPLWVLPELASSVKLTLRAQLPGSVVACWELGGGLELVMSIHTSPDGAGGCVQHYSFARNFLGFSGLDAAIRETMVEHLMKPIQGLAEKRKRLTGSVWAGTMLSQLSSMRSSFLKMGYGVLPETFVERFRNDM